MSRGPLLSLLAELAASRYGNAEADVVVVAAVVRAELPPVRVTDRLVRLGTARAHYRAQTGTARPKLRTSATGADRRAVGTDYGAVGGHGIVVFR